MKDTLSRRGFLKDVAIGSGALALLPFASRLSRSESDVSNKIDNGVRKEAVAETLLPNRLVTYRAIVLPEGINSNVSFIDYNIAGSPIEAADHVLKLGGADVNSGSEAALITVGSSAVTQDMPMLEVYYPGEAHISLQQACTDGSEIRNDNAKLVLVADANKAGAQITLWADDEGGHGSGQSFVIDEAMLNAAPKVEFLAVRLPDNLTANKESYMASCSQDVTVPGLGEYSNWGHALVGVKDGTAHGMMLKNNGNYAGSLETCLDSTNDMGGLTLLVPRALENESTRINLLRLWVDDINGQPSGEMYSLDLNQKQFRDTGAFKDFDALILK